MLLTSVRSTTMPGELLVQMLPRRYSKTWNLQEFTLSKTWIRSLCEALPHSKPSTAVFQWPTAVPLRLRPGLHARSSRPIATNSNG